MTKMEAYGRGGSVELYKIPTELAERLVQGLVTEDEFNDLIDGGELDLVEGESGISSDLQIFVDGKEVSIPNSDIEALSAKTAATNLGEKGQCYIIVEDSQKGCWLSVDIDGEFEPTKVELEMGRYLLPNGSSVTLTSVSYDGKDDFGDTTGKGTDYTLVMADGSSPGFDYADEEDSEDEDEDEDERRADTEAK